MIDIHSHILYGVDDGAKDLSMSLDLIEEAKEVGFDKIIFTSHYMNGYFMANSNMREKVLAEIDNTKNVDVDLFLGNEIFLNDNIMKLLHEKKAVTLNNSRYILFELPFNIKPINFLNNVFKMQSNNFVPILAHPERYAYFYKNPEIYEEFVKKGILLQVNFGSFDGLYGSRAQIMAERLLKANLVHFIASDVHRPQTIYPEIPRIVCNLEKLVGKDKIYELTTINPQRVIDNKDIEIEDNLHIKWSLFEKMKMKEK